MPDLKFLPLSYMESLLLSPLMEEEEGSWLEDLFWDYAPIRKILLSFMDQKLLSGYIALQNNQALGYAYFLANRTKGIVGNIYVTHSEYCQEIADRLLSMCISGLKDLSRIQRIEAQIMPFNNMSYTDIFVRNGFLWYPRCYLTLDLHSLPKCSISAPSRHIAPWNSSYLSRACEIVVTGYEGQTDAAICSDYRTLSGCQHYLRSILENPGSGIFMPETSFIALDDHLIPCGFVFGSRISAGTGMIPQIAVHPSRQGKNLGRALMYRCVEMFRSLGFKKITLAVSQQNRKAYEWYDRLGFRLTKEFGAFTWDRK